MGTGATVRETRTSPTTTSERKLTSYDTAVYTTDAIIMTRTYIPINLTTMMLRSLKMAIFHTGLNTAVRGEKNIIAIIYTIILLCPPTIQHDLLRRDRRRHALITPGFVCVSGFITRVWRNNDLYIIFITYYRYYAAYPSLRFHKVVNSFQTTMRSCHTVKKWRMQG